MLNAILGEVWGRKGDGPLGWLVQHIGWRFAYKASNPFERTDICGR